ncbi:MAG: hypothetical protein HQ582_06250, partial [Planctomycetes bacterium]|nr:hypothetical protein [Planctomycetota bacterium]
SDGSLLIHRTSNEGQSAWQFDLIDPGHFPGFRLQGRYRVSARVRTDQVTGGARLGWQVISPQTKPELSQPLAGTNEWTLLEMETADVGPARRATVRLIQEGGGRSWFDDLKITPIP